MRFKTATLGIILLGAAALHAATAEDSLILAQERLIQEVIDRIDVDSMLTQVRILSGEQEAWIGGVSYTILSRHYLQPGNALAADYLFQELTRHGLSPFIDYFGAHGENVVAFQQGYLHPEQQFIICGHYDCQPAGNRAFGADDNASGTAAVLEAARLLARQRMPYTVIYALWDEEEIGLLGARSYAGKVAKLGHQILGVINMDMIAWDGNGDNIVTLHARPIARSLDLAQRLVDINTNYGIGLDPWIVNPGTPNSDHAPFWDYNYSSILIIEDYRRGAYHSDFNPYYHTVNDRIMVDGNLVFDLTYFLRCARMCIGSLVSYACDVAPAAPLLAVTPLQLPVRTTLAWHRDERAREYTVQLSPFSDFSVITFGQSVNADTFCIPGRLAYQQHYFWRVRGRNRGGSGLWSEAGEFTTSGRQHYQLGLEPGWNLVSTPVAPEDPNIGNLFTDKNMILRDAAGRRFSSDRSWDERKVWSMREGYWIHAPAAASLDFTGWEINTAPAPLALQQGWQIIPWWYNKPMATDSALASLGGRAVLLKDGAGHLYWPEEGIDQVGTLQPGRGYQLYLTAADTLLLPLNRGGAPQPPVSVWTEGSPRHYVPPFRTGANAHLLLEAERLTDGDEVAVWAEGRILAGAGTVQGGRVLITIWGDDIATPDFIDGAQAGSPLTLTLWSNDLKREETLLVENLKEALKGEIAASPLAWAQDALWRGTAGEAGALSASLALRQNYPNPFNAATVIRYELPQPGRVVLRVINVNGREVARLAEGEQRAGLYEVSFRAENNASGLYWAELQTNEKRIYIKMMLVR